MQLFFGIDVIAPWPEKFPGGRILEEKERHMTLAFLGKVEEEKIMALLPDFPKPDFKVGIVGKFDQCLFLPPRHPRVVAWNIQWLEESGNFDDFLANLFEWLEKIGFVAKPKREFCPHVTLSRGSFIPKEWEKTFTPLPAMATDIHLFESLGFSKYRSLWKYRLKAPFEELEHTGDIAFIVRGESLLQLFQHAQLAMAFPYPPILPYLSSKVSFNSLDEIVMELNTIVTQADQEIGVPFKGVSFHGKITQEEDQTMCWEMIIDV